MEAFDILDREGSPTGIRARRGDVLSKGQYYMGAHAYIHNSKGEFLLQQRSKNKNFLPLGWDIHMGHVMAGETSESAIKREIYEEIGVKVHHVSFYKRMVWDKYNHIIDVYVLEADIDLSKLVLEKSEVEDVKYVSKNEMIDLIRQMDYRPVDYRQAMESYVEGIR